MSLKIKNPKMKVENFEAVVDFGVELNLEGIRAAKAFGGEVYEEFFKVLGKGIIEGLEAMEIDI